MEKRMINKHRMLVAVLDFLLANAARLTFAPAIANLKATGCDGAHSHYTRGSAYLHSW